MGRSLRSLSSIGPTKANPVSCPGAKHSEYAPMRSYKGAKPSEFAPLRSYKGAKHSEYAPKVGVHYDGIYKVVKYWPHKGKSGFVVWRFLFRRDDSSDAPWEKGAYV